DENEMVFTNNLSEANFNNCIIYGNDNPEFFLDKKEGSDFNFKFTNCLMRFQNTSNVPTGENYDFTNTSLYENVIFNEDPDFLDPSNNKMMIGDNSAANNQGNGTFANQVPNDILNMDRT